MRQTLPPVSADAGFSKGLRFAPRGDKDAARVLFATGVSQ